MKLNPLSKRKSNELYETGDGLCSRLIHFGKRGGAVLRKWRTALPIYNRASNPQ